MLYAADGEGRIGEQEKVSFFLYDPTLCPWFYDSVNLKNPRGPIQKVSLSSYGGRKVPSLFAEGGLLLYYSSHGDEQKCQENPGFGLVTGE